MLNTKKAQMFFFVKWGLIIFGAIVVIIFLFGSSIPYVANIMEKLGLVDMSEIESHQQPTDAPVSIKPERTEAEQKAVDAFNSVVKSINDCKAKAKTGCFCDLEVPLGLTTGREEYAIQFRRMSDYEFAAFVFKNFYHGEMTPPGEILADEEFEGLMLCRVYDMLEKDKWKNSLFKLSIFNIVRDTSASTLFFYISPKDWWPVLGTQSDYEDYIVKDKHEGTTFKMYKYNNNQICFIIGVDDNAWGSHFHPRNLKKYRIKIEEESKNNMC